MNLKRTRVFTLLILLAFLTAWSCQDKKDFGINLLPDKDKEAFIINDTSTIRVRTILTDTTHINGATSLLVGNYNDPIFGSTTSSFAIQYIAENAPTFTDTDIADSVVAFFSYKQYNNRYGNQTGPISFDIVRLTEYLKTSSVYKNSLDPNTLHQEEILRTYTFTPKNNNDTIRIKLSDAFANDIFAQSSATFLTDTLFKKFFKGIYIRPHNATDNQGIFKFTLGAETKIKFYYHNTNSLILNFTSNSTSCVHLNLSNHNYSNTSFVSHINSLNFPNDNVSYIQGMTGVKTRVDFPYIKNWKKIEILRAQLVVKTESPLITNQTNFPALTKLKLTALDSLGHEYKIAGSDGLLYVVGYLAPFYSNLGEYSFDISNYINQIINNSNKFYGFNISSETEINEFERSVITTGKHENKMKLILTYHQL